MAEIDINNPFYGKKHTLASRLKMSQAKRGLHAEKANRWKGSKAKYSAIHMWVRKQLGIHPVCCVNCGVFGKKNGKNWSIQYANMSGEYKRDLSDWKALCRTCNRNTGVKIPEHLREGVVHFAI